MSRRPTELEYYAFVERYISKVPDGEVIDLLEAKLYEVADWMDTLPEELGDYRYAENKWSLKQVLGHIIDTERVLGYRLLRGARGDQTPLSGFDEEYFVKHSTIGEHSFPEIAREYTVVRQATLTLLAGLSRADWDRRAVIDGNEITVRALAYAIAGHELHHLGIMKLKYLPQA